MVSCYQDAFSCHPSTRSALGEGRHESPLRNGAHILGVVGHKSNASRARRIPRTSRSCCCSTSASYSSSSCTAATPPGITPLADFVNPVVRAVAVASLVVGRYEDVKDSRPWGRN